jgi:radical SAM protein with 4Fe4S-binding SPASM domain
MQSEIFQRFREKSVAEAIPLQASLELTYRCNERCTHCYIEEFKDDPKRILNKEGWFQVLTELRSAGTLYLILMGGEPTLSPYYFDIIERGAELGFHVSSISNGLKIKNQDYADRIKTAGLKLITFSLYSMNPEVHDKMTKVRGSHEKLMQAIDYCDKAGIKVSLNGLLTEANSRGIFDLYDWSMERGFELKVDPNITPKLNGDREPTQYRASRDTLLWFYRERTRRWKKSRPTPILETDNSYVCNAAKGKCAVNPYGELLPCIEIRESFGNLSQESFHDIWNSAPARKWREPRIKNLTDKGEPGLYGFCDHCPGMAKNEHGDPMKLTDYTKVVAEVKRQVYQENKEKGYA